MNLIIIWVILTFRQHNYFAAAWDFTKNKLRRYLLFPFVEGIQTRGCSVVVASVAGHKVKGSHKAVFTVISWTKDANCNTYTVISFVSRTKGDTNIVVWELSMKLRLTIFF